MRYKHVVEIGAGDSSSSQGLPLMTHVDKVTLYEPNIVLYNELSRAVLGMYNVSVFHAAVAGFSGTVDLYHIGYASYLEGAPSFLATSIESYSQDYIKPLLKRVPSIGACDAIPNDTDYLILTANGCEYGILNLMVARPTVIRTKHYCHNAAQWEQYSGIGQWMASNGYVGKLLQTNQHQTFLHMEWTR